MNEKSKSKLFLRPHEDILLSLIVPVFNEQETVEIFLKKIIDVFHQELKIKLDIVFVNDGSSDNTLERLLFLQKSNKFVRIVDLSRNFGKEAALTAGLNIAIGDVVVPIDVDLQDPPEIIPKMLDKWREGFEVVLGMRADRNKDSWYKQKFATCFYMIHNSISDLKIPENVGDFRLMDRRVVNALNQLPESRRFMKGIFAWAGFRTTTIEYARPERIAGKTKFNGWRLWNLGLEGITSFSTAPLRVWSYLGISVFMISLGFAFFIIARVLIFGIEVPGYASLMVAVTFLGGLQLVGIGVLGEYLGRNYIESKRRPIYLIREIFEDGDK